MNSNCTDILLQDQWDDQIHSSKSCHPKWWRWSRIIQNLYNFLLLCTIGMSKNEYRKYRHELQYQINRYTKLPYVSPLAKRHLHGSTKLLLRWWSFGNNLSIFYQIFCNFKVQYHFLWVIAVNLSTLAIGSSLIWVMQNVFSLYCHL